MELNTIKKTILELSPEEAFDIIEASIDEMKREKRIYLEFEDNIPRTYEELIIILETLDYLMNLDNFELH